MKRLSERKQGITGGSWGEKKPKGVSHVKHHIAGFSKFYQVICDGQSSLKNWKNNRAEKGAVIIKKTVLKFSV